MKEATNNTLTHYIDISHFRYGFDVILIKEQFKDILVQAISDKMKRYKTKQVYSEDTKIETVGNIKDKITLEDYLDSINRHKVFSDKYITKYYNKRKNKTYYIVRFVVNNKQTYFGSSSTIEGAKEIRNLALIEYKKQL